MFISELKITFSKKNGIQEETHRNRSLRARSVPSEKHNLASRVVDNPPESHSMFDATVVATPTKVGQWVQVVSRKRHNDIKMNLILSKVVKKLKTDRSDRSAIFHGITGSEFFGPKPRFEHDNGLIKQLVNQRMPQNIYRVTLLKLYILGSQANLKPNQTRLIKVVFKSVS